MALMAKLCLPALIQKVWREYEVPPALGSTQLFVDRHFRLKPLARLLGASPLLAIVLIDKHRARIFDLRLGELTEREDLFHPLTRRAEAMALADTRRARATPSRR